MLLTTGSPAVDGKTLKKQFSFSIHLYRFQPGHPSAGLWDKGRIILQVEMRGTLLAASAIFHNHFKFWQLKSVVS